MIFIFALPIDSQIINGLPCDIHLSLIIFLVNSEISGMSSELTFLKLFGRL